MKYLSLFSGIGGFELGIGGKAECIGYSEIDKYAIQIYEKHFPTHTAFGDITKIEAATLPNFDLLVGGFPCQSFSIAGKRGGFSDTRGTLFFEIARIAREKQPRFLLLENVKGLLSHDKGRTFYTIISTLDELGYDCQWQVLNSKNFGVPQNRERVFIIGHLRGTRRPQVFPFGEDDKIYPINSKGTKSKTKHTFSTIATNTKRKESNYIRQPLRFLTRNQKNIEGDYSFTVDASQTSGIRKGDKIRRLTPTECERLQSFPDDWTEGVSDTQRYKCLGNAVTVNVVQAIIEKLL
ncbi:DNA (cytosine-5-)-methyltransferase [Candidatus Fermentibacteria bacterium]|nr:MAG: DNA (cytosine-5-)-methyltransferase [Candidatus Fermentibacteria bacterium]